MYLVPDHMDSMNGLGKRLAQEVIFNQRFVNAAHEHSLVTQDDPLTAKSVFYCEIKNGTRDPVLEINN